MRLAAYAGASAVLAGGTLIKAFSQRPNFYSATVYLSQSNACILILANLSLVCAVTAVYGLQRLLYGPLRPIEIEQLSEKAWYAVLDTLLAMPSLRDDVGGWLVAIFFILLAGKIWGWIAEGRVDLFEQQAPQRSRLFHVRLVASLLLSLIFDALMVRYCLRTVMANPRPGMMIIFTFEFAILAIASHFTTARYGLALLEARHIARQTATRISERKAEIRAERLAALRTSGGDEAALVEPTDEDVDENEIDVPGWEEKRKWLFGLELATDFIKIVIYTIFFTISMAFMGLPMHVMRDVYLTIASFTKRIQDYVNYRRATKDMNTRYPDAAAAELSNDNTCIVCRETMDPWNADDAGSARHEGQRAKKLPCGHILHLRCLKAWLERQQVCPTCRRPVVPAATARPGPAPGPQLGVGGAPAGLQRAGQGRPGRPVQGVAQPHRPVRARWLNLGPVRLGFVGGPYQQVREALNRVNDQAGTGNNSPSLNMRPATALTNEQHLRVVEFRLLQEAHNLQVDRAQLATVRALETELGRLRELRIDVIAPAAPAASAAPFSTVSEPLADLQRQLDRMRNMTTQLASGLPNNQPMPQIPTVVQRYALGGQQVEPTALPPGLVLPEGWSLTPLARATAPSGVLPGGVSSMPQGLQMANGYPMMHAPPSSIVATGQSDMPPASEITVVQHHSHTHPQQAAPTAHEHAQSGAAAPVGQDPTATAPVQADALFPPAAVGARPAGPNTQVGQDTTQARSRQASAPASQSPAPASLSQASAPQVPPSRGSSSQAPPSRDVPTSDFTDAPATADVVTAGPSNVRDSIGTDARAHSEAVVGDRDKGKAVTIEDVPDEDA